MEKYNNFSGVMEVRNHFKNGASSKSLTSRENFRIIQIFSNLDKVVGMIYCILTVTFLVSCAEYDDSEIREQLSDHAKRIASLESAVTVVNAQISEIQSVLSSIQEGDWITSVTSTSEGYTINFANGNPVTIKHGTNGQDGNTPNVPLIGVALDGDVYYWTITIDGDTEWVKDDNGNKILATSPKGEKGDKGDDGEKGTNGLTPVINIDTDGYWTIKWGDNPAEHLLSGGQKVLARVSDIPFRLNVSVASSELVFDFFESGNIIRIPFSQPFAISIAGITGNTLDIDEGVTEEFTVVANITANDYLSLSAKIIGRAGNAADVHIRKSSTTSWGVEVGTPNFNTSGATFIIKITAPTGVDFATNEPNAHLSLSLLRHDGKESTAAFAVKVLYGTEQNPYLIGTAAELVALAAEVNAGDDKTGKFYRMTADIDLSDYVADYNDGKGWVPIGLYVSTVQPEYPFSGNFDGNGFKVSGLFINDVIPNSATGLFGYVYGGMVKNLGVEVDITGCYRVGSVAGFVENGSIENCYATGVIRSAWFYIGGVVGYVWNSNVENCYSTVMVSGGNYVGGVVGEIAGSVVKNCYSTGSVSGETYVGGVLGGDTNNSSIINCYATGAVSGNFCVGGVQGVIGGNLKNCAALNPSITRTSGSHIEFGRVTGRIYSNSSLTNNVAWDNMTAGGITFGVGAANNANGTDITAEQAKTFAFWTIATITWEGWDINIWDIADGRLPVLKNIGGNQNTSNPTHLQ